MADTDIGLAARITFLLSHHLTFETFQWGISTSKRGASDVTALLPAMSSWYSANVLGLTGQTDLVGITYSEWEEGTDFTGFHQKQHLTVTGVTQSGGSLPPQCAEVISLLDANTSDAPIRNRRGRIYFGIPSAGSIGTDGKFTVTHRDAVLAAFQLLDDTVRLSGGPPIASGFAGLCIASAKTHQLIAVTHMGVGRAVDTQRRRREKQTELLTYAAI